MRRAASLRQHVYHDARGRALLAQARAPTPRRRSTDASPTRGECRRVSATRRTELLLRRANETDDCRLAEPESTRDLTVRQPVSDELEDFALAAREETVSRPFGGARHAHQSERPPGLAKQHVEVPALGLSLDDAQPLPGLVERTRAPQRLRRSPAAADGAADMAPIPQRSRTIKSFCGAERVAAHELDERLRFNRRRLHE